MSQQKSRTMYMHTWKGRPARWDAKAKQIFGGFDGGIYPVVASLRVIRRQQSADWKRASSAGIAARHGWTQRDYGYVRVEVPNGH